MGGQNRSWRAGIVGVVVLGLIPWAPFVIGEDKVDKLLDTTPTRVFGAREFRHGSRIQSLVFLPAGAFPQNPNDLAIAAGGANDPLRIWNAETGALLKTIDAPWTQALAWFPKAKFLVAGNVFRTLRVVQGTGPVADQKVDELPAAIACLVISPDGKPILAGLIDGKLVLYFVSTRRSIIVPAHAAEVNAVAVDSTGKLFASGGGDRTIHLWKLASDLENIEKVRSIASPGMVHALAFLPDGKTLVSAGDDHAIRLWDVETGKNTHTFAGHEGTVSGLALTADGRTLVSSSHDATVGIWDVSGRKKIGSIPIRFGDADRLALSPDGKRIAVAGVNNVVRVFDLESKRERDFGPGARAPLVRLALVGDRPNLATLAATGDLLTWDVESGKPGSTWSLKSPAHGLHDAVLGAAPDGSMLFTGNGPLHALELWEPSTGRPLGAVPLPPGETLLSAALSPNGKTFAVGFRSGAVHLIDAESRETKQRLKASGPVSKVAFARNVPVLATAAGGKAQLWDVPTGQALRGFFAKADVGETLQPPIADLAFSPDGKTLAMAGFDGAIRCVDWTSGKPLASATGHRSAATSVAFSPDGRLIASASHDKTVRLWESFSGNPVGVFKGHDGPATGVAFAADGRTVYSIGADSVALRWDPFRSIVADVESTAARQRDQLWEALALENAAAGQVASWRYVATGRESVEFIGGKVYLLDPDKVDQLFRELDDREFHVREKATVELEKYGRWIEGRLISSLEDPPSLEVKRRLERMIGLLQVKNSVTLRQERLRVLRVIQSLEQIGGEDAIQVLTKLSTGAAEPDLQREAQLALARLRTARTSK